MGDRKKISSMVIGDAVKGDAYLLKSLTHQPDGSYSVLLSDKTGDLSGVIPAERWENTYKALVGGAVSVHAVIHVGTDNAPLVKVKSLGRAGEGTYKPSDLFDGLSEEQIKAYKGSISKLWEKIPSAEIKDLVRVTLTKETLKAMSLLPASLDKHGRYMGGALAATAGVASIATSSMVSYVKAENGLYHLPIEWSILVGAALLHMAAIPEYYTLEQPFRKTEIGVQRGYLSLLQSKLESVVREKNLSISEGQMSKLLNTLESGRIKRSGVSPTSPEGHVLRSAIFFYSNLDRMSSALDGYDFREGSIYTWLDRVGYAMEEGAA